MNSTYYEEAKQYLVGGVNSPVRSCKAVGATPKFIVKGQGPYVWDADGHQYIDYVGSFGAALAGHAHEDVLAALQVQMMQGLGFSAPHPAETDLAERITKALPSAERVRFVNSGTEAVQTAIRLARGITGRPKIIKFAGGYHGHVDCMLVKAGSGALTLGQPSSDGVVDAHHTLVAQYNDIESVRSCIEYGSGDIAAVIVEPVAGNMGCILPGDSFLAALRSLCDESGALLIFDEVMTGFRVAAGSAQTLYDVMPDLTTLGKVIGGGLPVGAIAGPAKHMSFLAPDGPVYQAGTLSGNPMTMVAGLATLDCLEDGYDEKLFAHTQALAGHAQASANHYGLPLVSVAVGGMWGIFFSNKPVENFKDVQASRTDLFPAFYRGMLAAGIYWPPSAYEAVFISIEHDEATLARTQEAFDQVFSTMAHLALEEQICV